MISKCICGRPRIWDKHNKLRKKRSRHRNRGDHKYNLDITCYIQIVLMVVPAFRINISNYEKQQQTPSSTCGGDHKYDLDITRLYPNRICGRPTCRINITNYERKSNHRHWNAGEHGYKLDIISDIQLVSVFALHFWQIIKSIKMCTLFYLRAPQFMITITNYRGKRNHWHWNVWWRRRREGARPPSRRRKEMSTPRIARAPATRAVSGRSARARPA